MAGLKDTPVSIGATASVVASDAATDAVLAQAFSGQRAMLLRNVLQADFLDLLSQTLARASFVVSPVDRLGIRNVEFPGHAGRALCMALSRPALLRWLEAITQCGALVRVGGEVTQFAAQPGHRLGWHDDLAERDRRLAITVNLGSAPYEGGQFELRDLSSPKPLFRHTHSELGAALIFRIADDLVHRVTPVTTGGPRMVFSGWFLAPKVA